MTEWVVATRKFMDVDRNNISDVTRNGAFLTLLCLA